MEVAALRLAPLGPPSLLKSAVEVASRVPVCSIQVHRASGGFQALRWVKLLTPL